MKKILDYLPLHFVVCVILGIVLQFYTNFWNFGFLKLFSALGLCLLILLIIRAKVVKTVFALLLFFILGITVVFLNTSNNYQNYFQKHLNSKSKVSLKISKILKSTAYHKKYEAEVIQVDTIKTRGKVLLNISKDSFLKSFKVDELVFAKSNFTEIQKPLHRHQFDYKFYLKKKGIHQQLFLNQGEFKSLGIRQYSFKGLSAKFRSHVQTSLKKYNFKTDELAVINALLLGQRQEISKELISNYSKAGAIHILAVSGLHVGILLWMLTWILKPLERLPKGKLIKTLCIVVLLWMFAFVAGLSASVVRAVTMFTFLAVGLSLRRKNVILFSLISSMFFLLIFKPMFLFDVGFQLSYLAVFGIVFIQPKLYTLYKTNYWLDRKIWEITSVSVAAQIGVLPLSLYYFHQFPGLFMLSNLVIIPFLGAILVGGIIIIIMALLGVLPQIVASFYGDIIGLLNSFVSWISKQEAFLFQEISFSLMMMMAKYLIIVFGFRFLIDKVANKCIYMLFVVVILQSVFLYERHQKQTKKEFIVFHKSRNSILANRVGNEIRINYDLDSLSILNSKTILGYTIGEGVEVKSQQAISNIFKLKNQQVLVVDSLGVYRLNNIQKPIVLLRQSPKINLERLIKNLQPRQIVVDGSNYKSYVYRWTKIAKKQKTPFHYTGKDGAFVYKY